MDATPSPCDPSPRPPALFSRLSSCRPHACRQLPENGEKTSVRKGESRADVEVLKASPAQHISAVHKRRTPGYCLPSPRGGKRTGWSIFKNVSKLNSMSSLLCLRPDQVHFQTTPVTESNRNGGPSNSSIEPFTELCSLEQ